jgi:putative transposase
MPRQPRIEYEGAIYHVMNRGDRREEIVLGDEDRQLFVATLAETCVRCGWEVHAWCLMNNHFHLVLETPLGNLVAGMKWFLGTYTMRFNARHRMRGHLFAGRYKSLIIDDRDASYLRTVADYVHLNPARAGLIKPKESLDAFRWSSYGDYLAPPSKRPKWLRTDRVMGEHGVGRDDRRGRLEFAKRMEALWREKSEQSAYKEIRRGWRFGSEEFVSRMLERIDEACGDNRTRREQEAAGEPNRGRGFKESGVGPRTIADRAERPSGKSGLSRAVARGDNDDFALDRRKALNGDMDPRLQPPPTVPTTVSECQ